MAAAVENAKTSRRRRRPTTVRHIIAVSGAAALGKTHFCKSLTKWFRARDIDAEHIQLDGYLLPRDVRIEAGLSGYDPRATLFSEMLSDLDAILYMNEAREIPVYSHRSGRAMRRTGVAPKPVIILDGIMALHHEVRDRYPAFGIFFQADELVMKGLRLTVDMRERGYSVFQALAHVDKEPKEYDRWIYHQQRFADLHIRVQEDRHMTIVDGAA